MSDDYLFDLPYTWPDRIGPIERAARDDLDNAPGVPALTRVLAISLAHSIDKGMAASKVSVATSALVKALLELLDGLELTPATDVPDQPDNVVSLLARIVE